MAVTAATSKVTRRNQTTLPPAVREALNLRQGERIGYVIEGSEVRLINASYSNEGIDPVLDGFLSLIAKDIRDRPERIQAFPASLLERARELTRDIEIDHDELIEGVTAF
jgi:antitoxin PrlF